MDRQSFSYVGCLFLLALQLAYHQWLFLRSKGGRVTEFIEILAVATAVPFAVVFYGLAICVVISPRDFLT